MQIKTTMRHNLTSVRMTIIKKSTNFKCWRGGREKRTLLQCWWQCKLVQPPWRTVQRFLKNKGKTKNRTTKWSSNPTTGHISGENNTSKRYMHPKVHWSTIFNSQDMEATKCPLTEEEDVGHIYNGILFSHLVKEMATHSSILAWRIPWIGSMGLQRVRNDWVTSLHFKKEQNNAICSNMDEPRDYHTKRSKSEKDKYHLISLMWNLIFKNYTNELIYKKTHRFWKQTYGYQSGNVKGKG